MKRLQMGRGREARGFTLVELLLVMGIIIMLVGLLFPAVNAAITAVRVASTENTIRNLSGGLEAFKQDWGVYPPSSNKDGWPATGAPPDGFYALIYYLAGEHGAGWGSLNQNRGPFLGTATAAYGPYYKVSGSNFGRPNPVQDSFKPGKLIFYYRYEPGENPSYSINWNTGNGLPSESVTGTNFISQPCFELLVRPVDAATAQVRWVRQDYLLISAGADRYWGYVTETGADATVNQNVTQSQINSGVATCDDICNFRR